MTEKQPSSDLTITANKIQIELISKTLTVKIV